MSYLLDTEIVSLLSRRTVPAKLVAWMRQHEAQSFLSVVTWAELEYGVQAAPATHLPDLFAWLAQTRRQFAPATETLDEAVLVRWKQLLADLKAKHRTMTCEDSLIAATALFHGHTVATHNTRHFAPSGVRYEDPLA
jgi:hypothetical protein